MDHRTQTFEAHRAHLLGLAYRLLGSRSDAQDVVQDTYLRWFKTDGARVREPRAWLVTTCSRLALNLLQSARVRRERYVGLWLPEPYAGDAPDSPAQRAQIDETISMAFMLALENLSPLERGAYLLHTVFGYDFAEVAAILGRSAAACRQLAARARAHVRGARPRFKASPAEHRKLLAAFFAAAREGRTEDFKKLLTAQARLHADAGGRTTTAPAGLRGPAAIGAFITTVWRQLAARGARIRTAEHWLNGAPAMLVYEDDRLIAACCVRLKAGRIDHFFAHRNPAKLAPLGSVATLPPLRATTAPRA